MTTLLILVGLTFVITFAGSSFGIIAPYIAVIVYLLLIALAALVSVLINSALFRSRSRVRG
jgi:hypothetical protein